MVGIGTLLFLSGCILAENPGNTRVSVDGEELVLAICREQTISSIEVHQLAPDATKLSDWELVWAAKGELASLEDEPIVLGSTIDGLAVTLDEGIGLAPGTSLDIVIVGSGGVDSSQVRIPDGGLIEGLWLFPTGVVREWPCSVDREGISDGFVVPHLVSGP